MAVKLSKYVYIVENYPQIGKSMVFSTLTRMLLVLPSKVLHSLHNIPPKVENLLQIGSILVDEEIEEERNFEYWYNSAKLGNRALMFTVIPTYNCNCRCIYCYADGVKKNVSMSEEVCKEFINWVKYQVETYDPSMIEIGFHGGEPLLEIENIYEIGTALSEFADKKGIKKYFTIVTNGTLLYQKIVKKLVNIPVNQIMITIDGLPEIHNIRRPYKSGKGTFNDIFQNINIVLETDIGVILGPNIDYQNYQSIPYFLDFLVEKRLNEKENLTLFFGTVTRGVTPSDINHFTKYQPTSPKEVAQMLIKPYKEALIRDIRIVNPIGLGFCAFKKSAHHIVDPYGKIYRCITTMGREDSYVGTIYDELELVIQRTAQLVNLDPWRKNEECKKCRFLPLCLGGCGQQALLKYGTRNHIDCQKLFIEEYLPEVLKIAYERNKRFKDLSSEVKNEIENIIRV